MESSIHKIQRDIDLISCSGKSTVRKGNTLMDKYREWMYPTPKEDREPEVVMVLSNGNRQKTYMSDGSIIDEEIVRPPIPKHIADKLKRPTPPADKVENMYPNFNKNILKCIGWFGAFLIHISICMGIEGSLMGLKGYIFGISMFGAMFSAAGIAGNLHEIVKDFNK